MQKPEWTKIGTVEVCVGTDGVITGVWTGHHVAVTFGNGKYATLYSKEEFEHKHCQPPKPRHTIRHYADGSCVVESTEQDEQGRPLRCAMVRTGVYGDQPRWGATWCGGFDWFDERRDAIARAVRYVETGV